MTGPGTLLAGRYELVERIGAGGMATVWRARDTRLGRPVAVKILRPEFADEPGFSDRFTVEARHAASLSHPNVATVFDTGTDRGVRFIVMELVDGPSVAEILRARGPLPPLQAADISAAAARALAAAHRRGLIHRDVKPANILVGRDGRVRLADFGIARALTTSRVTMPGTVLGSVPYLSPEQARGEEATAGGDVFSLGVVLYEMLTGRLPWEADSPAALATVRVTQPAVPVARMREDLPDGLGAIVDRALRLDPATRYPSARALAETLEAWARRDAATLAPEPDLADTAALVAAGAVPFPGAGGADEPLVAAVPAGATVAGSGLARANPQPDGAAPGPIAAVAPPRAPGRAPRARREARATPRPVPRPRTGDRRDRRDRQAMLIALAALTPLVLVGLLGLGSLMRGPSSGAVLEATGTPDAAVVAPSAPAPTVTPLPSPTAAISTTPAVSDSPPPMPTATPAPARTAHPAVNPVAPTPAPTPRPTPRPTRAPATPPATAAPSTASAPARAVADFYDAVEAHDWDRAIARWSPSMQERYPPQEWLIDRFKRTTRIDITRLRTVSYDGDAGRARVAVTIVEYRTVEPSPRTLSGAWDLVRRDGRWLLDDPDF